MDIDSQKQPRLDITPGLTLPAPVPRPTEGQIVGYTSAVVNFPVYLHNGKLVVYVPNDPGVRDELFEGVLAAAQEAAEEAFGPLIPPQPATPARGRR